MRLFRNRYLVAIYDKQDRLVDVIGAPSELKGNNKYSVKNGVNRVINRHKSSKKYYIIDCLEVHDDIFKEEDEEFIKFINQEKTKTQREIALDLGMSERNYYRKKSALGDFYAEIDR